MPCAIDAVRKKDVFGLLVVWNKMSFYTSCRTVFARRKSIRFRPKSLAPKSLHVITEPELSTEQAQLLAVRDMGFPMRLLGVRWRISC